MPLVNDLALVVRTERAVHGNPLRVEQIYAKPVKPQLIMHDMPNSHQGGTHIMDFGYMLSAGDDPFQNGATMFLFFLGLDLPGQFVLYFFTEPGVFECQPYI